VKTFIGTILEVRVWQISVQTLKPFEGVVMTAVVAKPSPETKSLVKSFNQEHEVGEVVAYKKDENDVRITRLKSKAFISGRWKLPLVKLDLGKGNYSINKITQINRERPESKKTPKRHPQKNIQGQKTKPTKDEYQQLEINLRNEIQSNGYAFATKMDVLQLFPPIRQYWGVIDDVKQFQIWLREHGWKITSYSIKSYRIENTKR